MQVSKVRSQHQLLGFLAPLLLVSDLLSSLQTLKFKETKSNGHLCNYFSFLDNPLKDCS